MASTDSFGSEPTLASPATIHLCVLASLRELSLRGLFIQQRLNEAL